MILARHITAHLQELSQYFPILSLTGPRQAGKATLLQKLYPNYRYVSLEDPDQQLRATEDPRSFLRHYDHRFILMRLKGRRPYFPICKQLWMRIENLADIFCPGHKTSYYGKTSPGL
ncbi:MAG: AAA family ATPase [Phaeodactylibacter sp.]|nr:AAA family ATPase [Phaeodactylibacter sp.]